MKKKMKKEEYYLISENTLNHISPSEKSKCINRYGDQVCIVKIDFNQFKDIEESMSEDDLLYGNIWAREITDCNVSTDMISIADCQENGLFEMIMLHIGASTEKNVSAVIGGICKNLGVTPIELFNKL